MFRLSRAYKADGMYAYSQLQQQEFADEKLGFRAAKHQSFVGAGYFDAVQNTIMAGHSSTTAMDGSTEEAQLQDLFATAGTVDSVSVVRDRETGRARGFAFVEMGSDADAQQAINKLNSYQFGGRALTVNEARPKTEGGGGFGGNRRREPRW